MIIDRVNAIRYGDKVTAEDIQVLLNWDSDKANQFKDSSVFTEDLELSWADIQALDEMYHKLAVQAKAQASRIARLAKHTNKNIDWYIPSRKVGVYTYLHNDHQIYGISNKELSQNYHHLSDDLFKERITDLLIGNIVVQH